MPNIVIDWLGEHVELPADLTAETLAAGTSQISAGNQDLAERTEQQSVAIDATTRALAALTEAGVDIDSIDQVEAGYDPSVLPRDQVQALAGVGCGRQVGLHRQHPRVGREGILGHLRLAGPLVMQRNLPGHGGPTRRQRQLWIDAVAALY